MRTGPTSVTTYYLWEWRSKVEKREAINYSSASTLSLSCQVRSHQATVNEAIFSLSKEGHDGKILQAEALLHHLLTMNYIKRTKCITITSGTCCQALQNINLLYLLTLSKDKVNSVFTQTIYYIH